MEYKGGKKCIVSHKEGCKTYLLTRDTRKQQRIVMINETHKVELCNGHNPMHLRTCLRWFVDCDTGETALGTVH